MSERQPKEGAGGRGLRTGAADRVRRDEPRKPEQSDPDLEVQEDGPSEQEQRATNGERDQRMQHAVQAARRTAEERATAEILALEDDLERERQSAARSLEEVQRRLQEAEAKAAATATVTDVRAREEAAEWLREQRDDVRREFEQEVRGEAGEREGELLAERNEAAEALREAQERIKRAEADSAKAESSRAEAERRVRADSELRLAEHTSLLKQKIEALETEAEDRVREAVNALARH